MPSIKQNLPNLIRIFTPSLVASKLLVLPNLSLELRSFTTEGT